VGRVNGGKTTDKATEAKGPCITAGQSAVQHSISRERAAARLTGFRWIDLCGRAMQVRWWKQAIHYSDATVGKPGKHR